MKGIRENNTKEWFEEHRRDYEDYWLEPARSFVVATGAALSNVAPAIRAEPKVNGSIFRINRDIRFSKDKRPYKDHLDFWFWEGTRKTAVSGFYLRIGPTHLGIGAGAHAFDKEQLTQFRNAVVDVTSGLERAVADVEKTGWEVKGQQYKQVPRGFDAEGPVQDRFLRFGALWTGEDEPHPKSLHTKRLVAYCTRRWSQNEPLHRWLVDTLG